MTNIMANALEGVLAESPELDPRPELENAVTAAIAKLDLDSVLTEVEVELAVEEKFLKIREESKRLHAEIKDVRKAVLGCVAMQELDARIEMLRPAASSNYQARLQLAAAMDAREKAIDLALEPHVAKIAQFEAENDVQAAFDYERDNEASFKLDPEKLLAKNK
jgi:hypothetical protein